MASHKHCSALLDALNEKEVPIETTPQEVLSLMGIKAPPHPLLAFFVEDLPPKRATHTRPLQITIECIGAKVLMVLIDNGSTLNVCPLRTALTIGLDMETIIPSPLTVRHMITLQVKLWEPSKLLARFAHWKQLWSSTSWISLPTITLS